MQMKTTVYIEDDFDLDKIADCGQCFRARRFDDGMYRFITQDRILYIKRENENKYFISCDEDIWEEIWASYFDISRNYAKLRGRMGEETEFVVKSVECGRGLRILNQDAWEMLVTFIISQRKSIPAISKAVEQLCLRFGKQVVTEFETLYLFPTAEALYNASKEELAMCGLGYRTDYVMDAAAKVFSGELDLLRIADFNDDELFDALLTVRGVGKKVANCILLFGYGRTHRAPVDVWIERAINEEFNGVNPFPRYGEDAGIIQQYIFYYQKHMPKQEEDIKGAVDF